MEGIVLMFVGIVLFLVGTFIGLPPLMGLSLVEAVDESKLTPELEKNAMRSCHIGAMIALVGVVLGTVAVLQL